MDCPRLLSMALEYIAWRGNKYSLGRVGPKLRYHEISLLEEAYIASRNYVSMRGKAPVRFGRLRFNPNAFGAPS